MKHKKISIVAVLLFCLVFAASFFVFQSKTGSSKKRKFLIDCPITPASELLLAETRLIGVKYLAIVADCNVSKKAFFILILQICL